MENRLERLKSLIESSFLQNNLQKYYEHTVRVVGYTHEISEKYNINHEHVLAAAWIHDIGRIIDNTFTGHVKELYNAASPILEKAGFTYEEINIIINIAIKHHPSPTEIIESLECQIIYDADNLELVGSIGLMRWFDTLPSDTLRLKNTAQMFIDIYKDAVNLKGLFFYTDEANVIGAGRLNNVLEYCHQMIHELDLIYSANEYDLSKCQMYSCDPKEACGGKNIVLISGYRCAGKSYVSDYLTKVYGKYITYFSTNSVKTGDADAQIIGPKEVVNRYGNGESYIWFIKESLIECYDNSANTLLIDSVKSDKDVEIIKSLFPNDNIYILWLHSNYKTRLERYYERDIKNGYRTTSLAEHDKELEDLGILKVMKNANAVVFTDKNKSIMIQDLSKFVSQLSIMETKYESY